MEILDLSSPNIEALVDQKVQEAIALVEPVPPGATFFYSGQTAPNGWLKANGAELDRVLYADLFAAIGTIYGVGNGSTTFNLPDLRGVFVRGFDDGRGLDINREFGSYQLDSFQGHHHRFVNKISGGGSAIIMSAAGGSSNALVDNLTPPSQIREPIDDGNGNPRTSSETRGKNISLLPIIKY
ncbi:phage tail protein [Spirulina sp. 06S082]|uniref:phage tail protein n=1 Tax=Spirulina sp. 06S082 TaxID=3110248 RepID=UPI002B211BBC|nr:phage tail protein [Spirulina sp. 06S082]MEA5467982.1 phage tail protein [Spirulina sp. 06S082]